MSRRRGYCEVVHVRRGAAFGSGGRYGVILPEPMYRYEGRLVTDRTPCMLDCGDRNCLEWTDVRALPGETRREAVSALAAGRYAGAMYHVSECEMSTHGPEGE